MVRPMYLTGLLCATLTTGLFAQTSELAKPTACRPTLDAGTAEQFTDTFLQAKMRQYQVPGAAFSLVKDGRLVFAKGYGVADIETQRSVDPAHTLVRAYSVSKSFTAMAVMQLVDAGKLSLTENVNTYLELFKVPNTFPEPITLAHLLTHTSGIFDEKGDTGNAVLLARGKLRTMSLGEWLKAYLPPRKKPVGTEVEYSNFGSSLAGYLVEIASGQPYGEYMQQHVLDRLDMTQSSFLWPDQLPAIDEAKVAIGDARIDVGYPIRHMTPEEGDFANTPAANLLTTAEEMSHFMIAQLDGGVYSGTRILSAASIAAMHEPYKNPVNDWAKAPNMKDDVGYGFFWRNITGHNIRWLFHTGGWDGSLSDMELQPDLNLGYFLWYNQGGDDHRSMRVEFNAAFTERFFAGCP